jgi:hypothetical protein
VKIVSFDSTTLSLILDRNAKASTKNAAEAVADLLQSLVEEKARIIIPTPVLAEVLLMATHDGPNFLTEIKKYSCFQIRPFDEKAAIEFAAIYTSSIDKKIRRKKEVEKMKVTFDRQIVVIAKTRDAQIIYSDDEHVREIAEEFGLTVIGFKDLKIKPKQLILSADSSDASVQPFSQSLSVDLPTEP